MKYETYLGLWILLWRQILIEYKIQHDYEKEKINEFVRELDEKIPFIFKYQFPPKVKLTRRSIKISVNLFFLLCNLHKTKRCFHFGKPPTRDRFSLE